MAGKLMTLPQRAVSLNVERALNELEGQLGLAVDDALEDGAPVGLVLAMIVGLQHRLTVYMTEGHWIESDK